MTNYDFGEFIADFIEDSDTDEYMTVTIADELREKYGDDIPLNTACLLELVELIRKFISPGDDDFELFDFDGEDDI